MPDDHVALIDETNELIRAYSFKIANVSRLQTGCTNLRDDFNITTRTGPRINTRNEPIKGPLMTHRDENHSTAPR